MPTTNIHSTHMYVIPCWPGTLTKLLLEMVIKCVICWNKCLNNAKVDKLSDLSRVVYSKVESFRASGVHTYICCIDSGILVIPIK